MTSVKLMALFGVAITCAIPASAQEADQANDSDFVFQLRECRGIEENLDRLACFDRISGEMIAATDTGEVRVIKRSEIEKSKRQLFGFSLPSIGLFGGDDEEMDLLETKITSVRHVGKKQIIFSTEEGAIWRINDAPARLRRVKAGNSVVFKPAAMGSFFIRIEGQTGVKGRRVR